MSTPIAKPIKETGVPHARTLARLAEPGVDGGEARRHAKPSRAEPSEQSDVMQCGESFAGYQSHQLREFILVTATY